MSSGKIPNHLFFSIKNKNYIFNLCEQYLSERFSITIEQDELKKVLISTMLSTFEYFTENPPIPPIDELNKRTVIRVKDHVLLLMREKSLLKHPIQSHGQPHSQSLAQSHAQPHTQPYSNTQSQQYSNNSMNIPIQQERTRIPNDNDRSEQRNSYMNPSAMQTAMQTAMPSSMNMNEHSLNEYGNNQGEFEPLPNPEMEDYEEEYKNRQNEFSSDDIFMKKLQELELQRNASLLTPSPQPIVDPVNSQNQNKSSNLNTNLVTNNNTSANINPNAPTVLYVPTIAPIRSSKSILIHSVDRMWDYFHDRSSFGWAGPLPDLGNGNELEFGAILLPSCVASETPIVEVKIEGVGNNIQSIFCVLSNNSSSQINTNGTISNGWHIWKPITEGLSILKSLPCPWNIHLLDSLGEPLQIGKDAIEILEVDYALSKGNTRLVLAYSSLIIKGSILMWKDDEGKLKRAKVLNSALNNSHNILEIEGDYVAKLNKNVLCGLWNMQSTIILEIKNKN